MKPVCSLYRYNESYTHCYWYRIDRFL